MADPRESELWQSWARDLGGEGELTAGEAAVLARVVEADAVASTAYSFLSRTQETLGSGRVQKAIQALAGAAGTVFQGARLLGLERKEKQVGIEKRVGLDDDEDQYHIDIGILCKDCLKRVQEDFKSRQAEREAAAKVRR